MSLRTRILLQLGVIVGAVLILAGVVVVALNSASDALLRVETAHGQYEAAVSLAEQANDYSEQIAETLLVGKSERNDYLGARDDIVRAFTRLRLSIESDLALLPEGPTREREFGDLRRYGEMRAVYRELEATVERAFLLDATGRRNQALAVFQNEIEDGLDLRLQLAIARGAKAETDELAETIIEFDVLRRQLLAGVLATAALLAAVSLLAGFGLFRAVMRPLRGLTEGAAAIEAGRLEHRIPILSGDELGRLAERFNQMTGELARQRDVLLDAQRALEEEVADRTAELQAANRRLTELDQQRVEFLADVSHELRTPLTAMRSEAEIALRGGEKAGGAYQDSLNRIVGQASEMGRLIEDLLFIARSEGGQIRFDARRLSLEELIRPAARAAETLAEARGIDLSVTPAPPDSVMGDPRRLSQTLLVLLDNAVRYSQPGSRVEVFARAANDAAEVVVRDWGAGVEAADLPHVFDRFFRGRRSVELNPGGSGLGLPIARWIAQQHGGDVRLERRGDGSDAILSLPLAAGGGRRP